MILPEIVFLLLVSAAVGFLAGGFYVDLYRQQEKQKEDKIPAIAPTKDEAQWRIIETVTGDWFPQVKGSMYGNKPSWLTIGKCDDSLPYSTWLYAEKQFSQKTRQECMDVIFKFCDEQDYQHSKGSAIKNIYLGKP